MISRFLLLLALLPSLAHALPLGTSRAIDEDEKPSRYSPAVGPDVPSTQMFSGQMIFLDKDAWAMPSMPYKAGMIANRPLDPAYAKLASLGERSTYFASHDFASLLAITDPAARQHAIDALSPAEKYDLAIGDLDRSFSTAIWAEVHRQLDHGDVPPWLGICDGSSSASVLFDPPRKKVAVASRIPGITVNFSVGDIKSLLAFSMTTYVAKDLPIFGKRCDTAVSDLRSGGCISLNPASLHELLLQMSVDPSRFPYMIIDRVPAGAIWNSALLSASVGYYNPQSPSQPSTRAQDNLLPVSAYPPPAGSPGWARGTKNLLFTSTTFRLSDTRTGTAYDATTPMKTMDLNVQYILEVGANGEILGGEWLSDKHPGFIWALPRSYEPLAIGDRQTQGSIWQGTAIPDSAMPVVLASSRQMQPLYRIVNWIYEQSK